MPDALYIEPGWNLLIIRLTKWVWYSHFPSKRWIHTSHTKLIITPCKSSIFRLLLRGWVCLCASRISSFGHRGAQAPSSAQWSTTECVFIHYMIRLVRIRHSAALVSDHLFVWLSNCCFSVLFWGWSLSWCQIFTPSCSCCKDSQRWDLQPTALWLPVRTITDLQWRFSQLLWLQAISSAIQELK